MRKAPVILLLACSLGFAPIRSRSKTKEKMENFSERKADVTNGYGAFAYQSTLSGTEASVADGRLRLRGNHEEGDQQLYLTAKKMTGRATWSKSMKIVVKLGGTAKDNVSWHVGVSVGRVKMLFHLGYDTGAFRVETVDTHEELFSNDDMGFTPATDVMHEMTIQVEKTERGARFAVAVLDGESKKRTYSKKFEVGQKQLGSYDRIGLERSGRRGGDALFDSVSIKLEK